MLYNNRYLNKKLNFKPKIKIEKSFKIINILIKNQILNLESKKKSFT